MTDIPFIYYIILGIAFLAWTWIEIRKGKTQWFWGFRRYDVYKDRSYFLFWFTMGFKGLVGIACICAGVITAIR